jgi:Ala-tRNA(Pro) deacylase
MAADRKMLEARLSALGIATTTVEHEAVFTVEQSAGLRASVPGAHSKSLFLADSDGHLVLVVARDETRVDLKALAKRLGVGRLSFGKPERLEAVLGVRPGAVTPFTLINASAADVTVVVDQAIMNFAEVNCHPLVNTATTRLATSDLIYFIKACGHEPLIVPLA